MIERFNNNLAAILSRAMGQKSPLEKTFLPVGL
jgi:hypothetical protein